METVKVGLLVDDLVMPVWVQRMLEAIARESGVEIALVVRNASVRRKQSLMQKAVAEKNSVLISAWRELDKRVFGCGPNASRMVDLTPMLSGTPTIDVTPRKNGFFDYFPEPEIERIAGHGITVFLQLGFRILRGDILKAASCGIWSYRDGVNLDDYNGPAGVWEVLLNKVTTDATLQMYADNAHGGKVLYRSWSATHPFSIHRNSNSHYWKTLSFVPRRLRELKQVGELDFKKRYAEADVIPFSGKDPSGVPDYRTSVKLITALLLKMISRTISKSYLMEQWILLYRFGQADPLPTSISGFKQLIPPKDRFWADPCVIEHDGKHVIFIEELEYSRKVGHLSVIEFDQDRNPVLPPVKILQKPYHLSYPFVFEDNGQLYMIPESQGNGTIELYRCCGFPGEWEFVMNLMENVNAVDTTIWRHDGKYWLFTNLVEHDGASYCDELFLYFSDDLLSSNWRPHPFNPIVSDVRCARPAGKIFESGGQWYRPSQDCSGRYGIAISVQRIELINEEAYRESPATRIDADWDRDITRVHTLSQMGKLTCIDGLKTRKRF